MYTLVVVVLKICSKRSLLARERYALLLVVANTFCLDGPVKPFNVGIVVRAPTFFDSRNVAKVMDEYAGIVKIQEL